MQVHSTPANKSAKVIATLSQRLTMAEKKIEALQSNTSFANPVTLVGGVESPNSTLVGVAPLTGVDTTSFTNSTNTFTQITNAWPIPANDALPGTAYRISASGTGSIGSTPSLLSFVLGSFGTIAATTGLQSGAATSSSFAWEVIGTLVIVSSTSAHFTTKGMATLGSASGGRAGGGTASFAFNGNSLSVSISPTSATTLMLQSVFGTPGTGTNMACNLSIFERL